MVHEGVKHEAKSMDQQGLLVIIKASKVMCRWEKLMSIRSWLVYQRKIDDRSASKIARPSLWITAL